MTEHLVIYIEDHADVAADGTFVHLHLKASQGDLTLTMDAATLESLSVRTTELFRVVRMRSGPNQPLETTVAPAKGIAAQAAIGAAAVILSIRDDNDLVHRFALHPQQSAQLRPQMRQAEIAAMKDAGETRQ